MNQQKKNAGWLSRENSRKKPKLMAENIETRGEDKAPAMVQTIRKTYKYIREAVDETTEEETRMVVAGEETDGAEARSTMKNKRMGEADTTPVMMPTIHETREEEEPEEGVAEEEEKIDEDKQNNWTAGESMTRTVIFVLSKACISDGEGVCYH
jgi:hypothetical protein